MNLLCRCVVVATAFLVYPCCYSSQAEDPIQPSSKVAPANDSAVERTRKQVRMLDDIYKGGIVLITEHYVDDDSDLAAGEAFKKLFAIAKKKGWHEVRLLDATGDPYNDENSPKKGFEQRAIRKLLDGKSYYDEIIKRDGKRYLQAATPVPVVMKKCVMCHEQYADVPKGRAVGALGYIIPVE